MYKRQCANLLKIQPKLVTDWIKSFDTVLTDCDGVLWIYNNAIRGSPETINKLKEIGKKVFFVTNNSTKTRAEFLEKALSLGFDMKAEEILSTAYLAAKYLKNQNFSKKAYVIGSTGISKELDLVGIRHSGIGPDPLTGNLNQFITEDFRPDDDVGAVVVGFDEHFSFPKMIRAASYLDNPDCLFVGTNTDERFPMPNYVIPGTGSIVRAIETCAERPAFVVGKPSSYLCDYLKKEYSIVPERTLMIGDRCNTDIALAKHVDLQTLLVGTGIHNVEDVDKWKSSDDPEDKFLIPDVFLPTLGDLLQFIH